MLACLWQVLTQGDARHCPAVSKQRGVTEPAGGAAAIPAVLAVRAGSREEVLLVRQTRGGRPPAATDWLPSLLCRCLPPQTAGFITGGAGNGVGVRDAEHLASAFCRSEVLSSWHKLKSSGKGSEFSKCLGRHCEPLRFTCGGWSPASRCLLPASRVQDPLA